MIGGGVAQEHLNARDTVSTTGGKTRDASGLASIR